MGKIIRFIITIIFICCVSVLRAQQQGVDTLKVDYPQLMQKFGKELEGQRADYIFAIDGSRESCMR